MLILILFSSSVPPSAFLDISILDTLDPPPGKTSILIHNSTGTEQLAYITSSSVCVFFKDVFSSYISALSLAAQMEMRLMNMHAIPELSVLKLAVAAPSRLAACSFFFCRGLFLSRSLSQIPLIRGACH